jgi:uncharacterized protein YbjT (DUF2867 family)
MGRPTANEEKSMEVALTGAFSYTGRYIAKKLLAEGIKIRALTNHPKGELFPQHSIPVFPLQFKEESPMIDALKGAEILINTYWIRYPHREQSHEKAAENIQFLVQCAQKAGVRQIIHLSVSNPSENSSLSYYKGKALAENMIKNSGMSYLILRPTLVFGLEDILINNIAWLLRSFPFFVLPLPMNYSVQPIYAGDVADIVFEHLLYHKSKTMDAAGEEVYRMDELVRIIARAIGNPRPVLLWPKTLSQACIHLLSLILRDRVLTREELQGLMDNLLISSEQARGKTSFKQWLDKNGSELGTSYINDFKRYYVS